MTGEIQTYVATKPNNGKCKVRLILIIGNDGNNQLQFVDLHYVITSSSADCGIYDVLLDDDISKRIGLDRKSVIKTTKIYTGPKTKLGEKIGELPEDKKKEFIEKYRDYQLDIITTFQI